MIFIIYLLYIGENSPIYKQMLSQISLDPSSKGNQYKPYILQHGQLCMYLDTSKYFNI